MDPIEKAIRKLVPMEQAWVEEVIEKLVSGRTMGLDIKKLRGREDIFRAQKGDVRIIYMKKHGRVLILDVGKRNDKTYSS